MSLFQSHVGTIHRGESTPPSSMTTLGTEGPVEVSTTRYNTTRLPNSTTGPGSLVLIPQGGRRRALGRRPRLSVTVSRPRQISLADFAESDNEDAETPSQVFDDEDFAALDAWGLRPGQDKTSAAAAISNRDCPELLKAPSAGRMPSIEIQCPVCLGAAVDTMSTQCGHVGCGPVRVLLNVRCRD